MLNAIFRSGPYTTADNRVNRWSRRGIWKRLIDTVAAHRSASGATGGEQNRAIGGRLTLRGR
jgi:hypothetical protein